MNWLIQNKEYFETGSYIAAIFVAAAAPPTIWLYLSQSRHASKSRLAGSYLGITKAWDGLALHRSIIDKTSAGRSFTTRRQAGEILLSIIQEKEPYALGNRIRSPENKSDVAALQNSMDKILSYFEDLGLLCRADYVSKNDIFDIMGGSIKLYIELALPYIELKRFENSDFRDTEFGKTIYANLLYLYEKSKIARRFTFSNYGALGLFERK